MEINPIKESAIYNFNTKIIEYPEDYPICANEYYFQKKERLCSKKCWYEEYRLCLNSVYTVISENGKYLNFQLKDYSIRDYKGLSFYIKTGNINKDKYEIYQSVMYNYKDCINLYYPVEDFNELGNLELIITASVFLDNNDINYKISLPKTINKETEDIINLIDKERKNHTKIYGYRNIEDTNFSRKLPYEESFINKAWELYPECIEFLNYLNADCNDLEKLIKELPTTIEEIDINPPTDTSKVIYVPLECTYNQKFFARLYLLRLHQIYGRIISNFDMLQYQIPISASNERLLLILYGSHWITPMHSDQDAMILGEDKCIKIYEDAYKNSPILSIIEKYKKNPYMKYQIIVKSNIGERYHLLLENLNSWITAMTKDAIKKSKVLKPSQWKSEYRLYQYIKMFFADAIYQYRSDWLGSQSLDIYIPSIQFAIEYQGKQHYESLEYFGGDEALNEQKNRDKGKLEKCNKQGVKLLEWSYDEKLLFSSIVYFLNDYVFNKVIINNSYIQNTLKNNLPFPVYDLFLSNTAL